ncbi:MAG TPA: hypothetical protein VGX25_08830 [Actinophytocola sp.]|uniref:hypothetical protein n=1 Tax=Actinophytocola sp. TaxID=1872138 RepID=UPI002DDCF242|nr:hypothetical protein [Actinophytocola sp.]HEV2779492.1 hypothetical protein [Actinophytocola sp.]
MTERALFAEPGSSRWPVLWGPAFAAAGAGVEALGGRVHTVAWILVGLGLAGVAALWVNARRRLLCVRVTPDALVQGQESLAVQRIARVDEADPPAGARVLGGGWTVPRRFTGVGLRLDDGSAVVAWARDGDGLRAALRDVISG